jgi:2-polyprenyl-6-methoxyphenol hydroxylase-like FAD-dependent oxidoreductase
VTDTDVLIAGAGPTGLVLALWLARLGVRVRIVDGAAEPGTTSRALVVQPRTLEFYRQIRLADRVVRASVRFVAVNLWVRGKQVGHVAFGAMGVGVSPYPYLVIFPQDEHERFLIERLRTVGIEVERPLRLESFEERGDRVLVGLKDPDGKEDLCETTYLAGCDGAHSTVRETLRTGFPGGTYSHLFYVADVEAEGPVMNHELHVALDQADFLGAFPMSGERRVRLIGTVRQQAVKVGEKLEWKDVSRGVIDRLGIDVKKVNWFSTYHVHHRVAAQFRAGRVFLLGDAAHIHSPVGGQGMNTGLGDAVNLAWKLAAVLQQRASERLLDTYQPERIAFAQRLVATTDRVFQLATSDGPIARFVRLRVVPLVVPVLFAVRAVRRFAFRTVSQTAIEYRDSALSAGAAGRVRGGDRLPWVKLDGDAGDNFAPLSSLDWQIHVYGTPAPALIDACKARGLALQTFTWRDDMRRAGLRRDAAYLVRPDGYVGLANRDGAAAAVTQYIDAWKLRSRPTA